MISVDEATAKVLALARSMPVERVAIRHAAGRVLARDVAAPHDQPPFAAAVMDGYAVARAEAAGGDRFRVVGEAAAGHAWDGTLAGDDALRIFTGAPMPPGGTRVLIQEDVDRDGDTIVLRDGADAGPYLRPVGADFARGDRVTAPRRLTPRDIALLAAMDQADLPVARRPEVALIATGDELVQPGEPRGPDQIVASNALGLAAMVEAEGARARLIPIARDSPESLRAAFDLAAGADVVVTIGGASVGDHDLVAPAAADYGLDRAFYRIAMRPGKPLMAGRMGDAAMLGLPGNPVSALVCGHVFLLPLLRTMLGLPPGPATATATLATDLPANGPRQHYMRARRGPEGLAAAPRQDSALLSVLAGADVLIVRRPHDPARTAGEVVDILQL